MTKKAQNNPFEAPEKPSAAPPKHLGEHGRALWRKIQSEYAIRDSGGLTILEQMCRAADRVEKIAATIERDGLTIRTSSGVERDHPLLKHETALRALISRAVQRLGLDVEPLHRGPGRPAEGFGVTWSEDDERDAETSH
jgi:P27 family predicted phage terminase small subunit